MIAAMLLAAAAPAAATVIDADRAFARLAQDKGQWTAFRATAAPSATLFTPQPTPLADALKDAPDPAKAVEWWPTAGWQSCDGTLGVTTGGAVWPDGHFSRYTTIWQREPGGSWKWVYDNGENVADAPARTTPALTKASCKGRPEPKIFTRMADHKQDLGRAADGSLVYWWTTGPAGDHRLAVFSWDGAQHAMVHDRAIAAPTK